MHQHMASWRKVGKALGVNPGVAHKYANTTYEPKREDLRRAFGLDEFPSVDFIRQKRGKNGRFK